MQMLFWTLYSFILQTNQKLNYSEYKFLLKVQWYDEQSK